MPFLRSLLSAITLFGGHFLNRRLDRVVLVGTLLILSLLAFIALPSALAFSETSNFGFITWALRLPLLIVGAVSLLSTALTFRDAQQPQAEPLTTTMRVTGVALSFVGVLLLGAASIIAASRFTPAHVSDTGSETIAPTGKYRPFYGHVSFGGGAHTWDLPAPPSGSERLRGRITLDRTGVEGVKIDLILNGKYKVEHLVSDPQGIFEIQVPAGDWHINNISVSEWDRAPMNRDLVLFSHREPKKGMAQYMRNPFMDDGLEISLPLVSNQVSVELELRDALVMTWPPRADSFSARGDNAPEADFSTSAITWQAVKAATEYEVQIAHVTREGTTTRFSPILMRRLSGLILPLTSLPQRSVPSALPDEYSVHVYAFDAQGDLLTESGTDLSGRVFTLAGETRLGKEEQRWSSSPTPPKAISAEYETNDLRLSLAEKLLDQKQFDEARRLLDQVTKDAPVGRTSALGGKLAALRGDCVTAMKLFDQAEMEGGAGCLRNEDRKLCANSQK